MTPSPTLQALIDEVKADSPGEESLLQLSQASRTVSDLEQVSDALLGHFVDQCRRSGHSWSEISNALGVSKQAAHKRFTFEAPTFERFTDRARQALGQSEIEARHLGHGFVGTEHILLALLELTDGLAARALDEVGISKSMAEEQILELIKRTTPAEEGKLPFTPRAKAVLRRAVEEALDLGHNYIGTEHLLLGLFGDEDSIAAKVLRDLGASYDIVRGRTLELLAGYRSNAG
jgi:Clp amino terminal domain, pathogenicity island component